MTTDTPPVDVQVAQKAAPREDYLNCSSGFMSWAGTLDHKRIGIMYLVGVSLAFLSGGLFALLVRLHLWEPEGLLFSNQDYNQIFTLHGAFMVFLFVIPAIPGSLGNMVLPQVLATPVLGITVLLVAFERLYHIGIFDPRLGGDPVLFEHFFWFYSHPAVYIMVLPAFGIISELVTVHSRKPLFGYKLIAFSSLAIAIISFLVWGHHMFTSGQSTYAMFAFSFLTFFVAIPTAIKEFSWVATVWRGSVALNSPMLYTLAFLIIFAIGGLTGVILGALNVDLHLHDTYFVVAHFHYVMMGSIALAFFAGLHHWWPKMFGKMYNEFLAKIAAVTIFIGFNATFLPQFVMGSRGMPRRYATYVPEYAPYHQASTIGAMVLGAGVLLMVVYLVASLFTGKKAKENQWGGVTLDWKCPTPPPHLNFDDEPKVIHEVYDYSTLDYESMQRDAT
jgi:cytochrome c oxidase subunit 1